MYAFTDETGDDIFGIQMRIKQCCYRVRKSGIRLYSLDKRSRPDLVLDRFPCMVGSLQAEDICDSCQRNKQEACRGLKKRQREAFI